MANQFTYFDNGTFESYGPPYNTQPDPDGANVAIAYGRTIDDKYAGNASLGIYTRSINPPTLGTTVEFPFRRVVTPLVNFPIVLTQGKKYRFTVRVKIDNANPIASNGMVVSLCTPQITSSYLGTQIDTEPDGGRIIKFDPRGSTSNGTPEFTAKFMTVAQIKANPWAMLWIEWIEPASPQPGSAQIPGARFSVVVKINFNGANAAVIGQAPAQSYSAAGKMWIDEGFVDEISTCDLAFGSPSYTKTNETGVGLDDGTVTINATSSFTKSYSKDNITWQVSNLFTGIPVGTTTFYVKDTNPNNCLISVPVTINAFTPAPPPPPPSPSNLEIDAKPVNANNFVSWFPGVGKITFTTSSISNCCWDIPAAYRIRTKGKNNMRHAIIAVNGEELTFYINFDNPINDPEFGSYRLALVTDTGLVQDNIGTLLQDVFADGVTYNIYGSVTLNGVKIDRYYKMVIYNTDTQDIMYASGLIEVMSLGDAKCLSTRLRYRCTINWYGFRYESVTGFFNIHRLRFYRVDEQEELNIVQYRAVSSGQLRNVRADLDRHIALEAYYFDDIAHRATGVFQGHDMIFLNDVAYLLKTPNKRTFDKDKELYKSMLEFYEITFSTRNRYNRLGNITVNSELLLQEFGGRVKL